MLWICTVYFFVSLCGLRLYYAQWHSVDGSYVHATALCPARAVAQARPTISCINLEVQSQNSSMPAALLSMLAAHTHSSEARWNLQPCVLHFTDNTIISCCPLHVLWTSHIQGTSTHAQHRYKYLMFTQDCIAHSSPNTCTSTLNYSLNSKKTTETGQNLLLCQLKAIGVP